jgi:putative NADPH-quinone reductase
MIVIGHPAPASFNHALAEQITVTWRAAGVEVALHDLAHEGFDPRLTAEEARGAPSVDPLVRSHIATLRRSDLLAVVHPNCWGAPPAIMKGWIDRVFAPDAAYAFAKGEDQGDAPVGLLTTKVALVVNTGNTPPPREQAVFGDPLQRQWEDCVLRYCGVREVMRVLFAVVASSSAAERAQWLQQTAELARQALRHPVFAPGQP